MVNNLQNTPKFKSLDGYFKATDYTLLPIRFLSLDDSRHIVTNLVGEHHVISKNELKQLVEHTLPIKSPLYNELKSKHMLMDSDSSVAIDLLSAKYREKFKPISNFTSLHLFVTTLRCEHTCPYCQVSRQTEDKGAAGIYFSYQVK